MKDVETLTDNNIVEEKKIVNLIIVMIMGII